MQISPAVVLLVAAILAFDVISPLLSNSEQAANTDPKSAPAEVDGVSDVLAMSRGGRVVVSFCTS